MTTCLEIVEFFHLYLSKHIKLVSNYWYKILLSAEHSKYITLRNPSLHIKRHDQTKFFDLEYTPHILQVWCYKNKEEPPQSIVSALQKATFYHVTTNPHHPEYWDKNVLNIGPKIISDDGNKSNGYLINAARMPNWAICEMVCDWAAISKEQRSSLRAWANQNVGIRWNFNSKQRKVIYDLIDLFE